MCSAGLHTLQILGEYVQCWATHATDIRGVYAVLGYTCYRYWGSMCSAGSRACKSSGGPNLASGRNLTTQLI